MKYSGLNKTQVDESRLRHGANILTPPEREPLWRQFLAKFSDPLIIILLIAGGLSVGVSVYEYMVLGQGLRVFFDPVGIFVAIMLATGLAFIFELKAEKEFSILNQTNDEEHVKVVRDGNIVEIARKDVVVDDIVILATGDEVPADGTLLEAVTLNVDESTLTGEPICAKTVVESDFNAEATYPSNHVLRGTKVMEGHGVFRVTAVGDKTEYGKVYEEAQIDDSVKTPLNEQLDGLGALVTKMSYGVAVMVVVGRVVMFLSHHDWAASALLSVDFLAYILQSLMIAVTLVVVAVPEGLPMTVTLCLAYSMRSMLRTNNLVRRMHACETMGATTVICTDKTGTLTQNKMQVAECTFDGLTDELAEGIAVNSTASLDFSCGRPHPVGNPTEGALLLWLHRSGYDYRDMKERSVVVSEVPFSTERKYMSTTVRSTVSGREVTYTKGAPEIVFDMCETSDIGREEMQAVLGAYQNKAYRTLGFARDKHFIGIVAISDPVREDVPSAVAECMNAGIKIKIVTGDTPGTAKEIGRQIGLWTNEDTERNIVTGAEVAAMSDEQLAERVADLKIIARARPTDKRRLVEAIQANGDVVAVTGDGTNDAPALNQAHVGLSMGDGTAVAKEASDITIIDNSFSSIGLAVMWGRSLYRNIQRFLLFQLTVNVTACLLVMCGSFMGVKSPLTVTQMLWVNLIMDTFAAMALASLPPTKNVMLDKPRDRRASILTPSMMRNIIGVGCLFFVIMIVFLYIFLHADIRSMSDLLTMRLGAEDDITDYELTLLFSIFVWTHFWYLFNARAYETGRSAFHFRGCAGFGWITFIIVIGQILIVEVMYDFFNVVPMSMDDWAVIIVGTSLVLWVREGWGLLKR